MENTKTEQTTNSDSTEPIISWSGVQGETQSEDVEIPNAEELEVETSGNEDEPLDKKTS